MKRSTDRILTTHVGSLPRPDRLLDHLEAEEQGLEFDRETLRDDAAATVKDIVARQVASGIDVVSDGEISKIGYTFYVKHRLAGIGRPDGPADPGAGARQRLRPLRGGLLRSLQLRYPGLRLFPPNFLPGAFFSFPRALPRG